MKKCLFIVLAFLPAVPLIAQKSVAYQTAALNETNLRAVMSISPYSTALGFDNRYEGIKGSPRLLDTLTPSLLLLKGQGKYYELETDIDVVRNTILFMGFSGGELMEIPAEHVTELVFLHHGRDIVFRTSGSLRFDRKPDDYKFYTVLKPGQNEFIKIPDRKLEEADYQGLYSPDIRYDEFRNADKYYIMAADSVYHRVQLTRKSLVKLFPDRKQLINEMFNEKVSEDPEADVAALLEKF
ncbi:MAG: hypothetical protein AB9888_05290 [Bacteroidales bacterium]